MTGERPMIRNAKFLLPALTCGMLLAASFAVAQQPLQTYAVQGNVHMITGAGGNIAVQTGPDGYPGGGYGPGADGVPGGR